MYLTCFLHPNLCSGVQNLTVSPMFMKHRLHSAQQPLHSIQRARLWRHMASSSGATWLHPLAPHGFILWRHMASSSGATWLHPLAPHGFILWRHMASSQCSEDREPEVQRPIVCCAVCLLCMRDHGNILRILPRLTMRIEQSVCRCWGQSKSLTPSLGTQALFQIWQLHSQGTRATDS